MTFPRTTTVVPGASRVDVAWMLAAGFAMPLGEGTALDLAWRYTDLGAVRTGRGPGRVVWRDGSREPGELNLAETRAKLRGQGRMRNLGLSTTRGRFFSRFCGVHPMKLSHGASVQAAVEKPSMAMGQPFRSWTA